MKTPLKPTIAAPDMLALKPAEAKPGRFPAMAWLSGRIDFGVRGVLVRQAQRHGRSTREFEEIQRSHPRAC